MLEIHFLHVSSVIKLLHQDRNKMTTGIVSFYRLYFLQTRLFESHGHMTMLHSQHGIQMVEETLDWAFILVWGKRKFQQQFESTIHNQKLLEMISFLFNIWGGSLMRILQD